MSRMRTTRWLPIYQWLAGMGEVTTGVLLVFAPNWTLSLMGVQAPHPVEFAGFIGVFVLSVGVSYWYAAWVPITSDNLERWRAVWWLTALSRSLVAGFLTWKILAGSLETAWLTVALTDGVLSIFQWTGLRAGWLSPKN
jgi:hypothetical protein